MARVGIDLDGVCYDFAASLKCYLTTCEDMDAARCTDPTRWEFYLDWGLSTAQFLSACSRGVDAGVVFLHGAPIEDAVAQIKRLKDAGHEVHIITDRSFGTNNRSQQNTYAWLSVYGVPYDSVTFTNDKTSVAVDYMIDDKPENYEALSIAGVKVALLARPWNEAYRAASDPLTIGSVDVVESLKAYVDRVLRDAATDDDEVTSTPRLDALFDEPSKFENETTGEVRTVSATGGEKGVKPARFDLIPAGPLWQVAEHYGKGAEKYAARNWERGYEWSKSFGAMQRHALAFWRGEDIDAETGSPHMAAVVFHALALLEFASTHREFDDRVKLDPSDVVLDRLRKALTA